MEDVFEALAAELGESEAEELLATFPPSVLRALERTQKEDRENYA